MGRNTEILHKCKWDFEDFTVRVATSQVMTALFSEYRPDQKMCYKFIIKITKNLVEQILSMTV